MRVYTAILGIGDNLQNIEPTIDGMPTSQLETRLTGEKWNEQMDELDNLYENANDGSNDSDGEDCS